MPTADGMYLVGDQNNAAYLYHVPLGIDATAQAVGQLPGAPTEWQETHGFFCALDGFVYFKSTSGQLLRASPEGVEGPLLEDVIEDLWCTEDAVLLTTQAALLSYDPAGGDVTTVIEQRFFHIVEHDGDLVWIDLEGMLHVTDLVSAEERAVLDGDPPSNPFSYAVDDSYVYMVAYDPSTNGRHLVRGNWR